MGNSFCIEAVVVAAACKSQDSERKSPVIPMIDVYCMKSSNSVWNGNSCKTESAKCSSYGNYGLVHVGSCSSIEAII